MFAGCVCHNEKKVPDKRQANKRYRRHFKEHVRQAQHKKNTRIRGPFYLSITAIFIHRRKTEKQFTNPTHVAVFLFQDLDRDRSSSEDDSGSKGQYR